MRKDLVKNVLISLVSALFGALVTSIVFWMTSDPQCVLQPPHFAWSWNLTTSEIGVLALLKALLFALALLLVAAFLLAIVIWFFFPKARPRIISLAKSMAKFRRVSISADEGPTFRAE